MNISQYLHTDGTIDAEALEPLRQLLQTYPYYHAARIMLVRLLFQQHDSSYSSELRRAALYLPSREAIFQIVEEKQFKPKAGNPILSGATVSRKAVSQLPSERATAAQRTDSLIAGFLNTLPSDGTPATAAERRLARPIDASQDYVGFMLQQEENERRLAAQEAARQSRQESNATAPKQPSVIAAEQLSTTDHVAPSPRRSDDLMDSFINDKGDKRIRLRDTDEGELQKPTLINDSTSGQGAFTEALARIYIKQGKFDHAIEIIQRLSLKYPKKNSYFADQIRFLEKLLENQRFSKGGN